MICLYYPSVAGFLFAVKPKVRAAAICPAGQFRADGQMSTEKSSE
jgi:hypothetical protein